MSEKLKELKMRRITRLTDKSTTRLTAELKLMNNELLKLINWRRFRGL